MGPSHVHHTYLRASSIASVSTTSLSREICDAIDEPHETGPRSSPNSLRSTMTERPSGGLVTVAFVLRLVSGSADSAMGFCSPATPPGRRVQPLLGYEGAGAFPR